MARILLTLGMLLGVPGKDDGWIALFDGKTLSGWQANEKPECFTAKDGILTVEGGMAHLFYVGPVKKHNFKNFELKAEVKTFKGANSGIYFQSRYELQIRDSADVPNEQLEQKHCGAIHERWESGRGFEGHPPRVNAAKPAGQWQTFDVVFRAPRFDADGRKTRNARFVKVVHNGTVVHENVEVTGPTRRAPLDDEKATGPLMLQGTYGPVAYRNFRLRPLAPEE